MQGEYVLSLASRSSALVRTSRTGIHPPGLEVALALPLSVPFATRAASMGTQNSKNKVVWASYSQLVGGCCWDMLSVHNCQSMVIRLAFDVPVWENFSLMIQYIFMRECFWNRSQVTSHMFPTLRNSNHHVHAYAALHFLSWFLVGAKHRQDPAATLHLTHSLCDCSKSLRDENVSHILLKTTFGTQGFTFSCSKTLSKSELGCVASTFYKNFPATANQSCLSNDTRSW